MPITLEISEQVILQFPKIHVAGFLARDLDVAARRLSDIDSMMEAARSQLVSEGLTVQNISADPRIAAWREAFARCGLKPSTYKGSAEQLGRRLLKGEKPSTPLEIVNLYCAVSARHLAPIGGYDVDRFVAPRIEVRHARPEADRFTPLGGRKEDMPLGEKVVVYACGDEVICWAFNHRDSRETCLSAQTSAGVFFSEGVAASHRDSVINALSELRERLRAAGAVAGEIAIAENDCRVAKYSSS
jgi:DNA/RNA-binding domain of Phe-tRNA-synthetase-like protein